MLVHPQFDPVAFSIGPVSVFWMLGRLRARESWRGITPEDLENLLFYGVFGVVLGGRLGYCLFYQPDYYLSHPAEILALWHGGMSAHGGLVGCILVMLVYGRIHDIGFFRLADFVAPLVPLGLMVGGIGNHTFTFLALSPGNYEVWVSYNDGGLPRHPSQLYESALEGLLFFIILWLASRKPRPTGFVSGLFCLGYGVARFFVEYFREPDAFLGLQALGLSRGQWLSVPLIVFGAGLMMWAMMRRRRA